MSGSWRSDRAGVGMLMAFALWVVSMAFVYALMTGQAQTDTVGGVARVAAFRTLRFIADSALDEASWVLRHPEDPEGSLLKKVETSDSGTAHEPVATREYYPDATIETVKYEVRAKSAVNAVEPWLIDLTVRVKTTVSGATASRLVRRRYTGKLVAATLIGFNGETSQVGTRLVVRRDPLLQVLEP